MFDTDSLEQWAGLILASVVSLTLLAIMARTVFGFLRYLLVRVPLLLRDPVEARGLIAIVIALVPIYELTNYLVWLASNLVGFIGRSIDALFVGARNCNSSCVGDLLSAASGISGDFTDYLRSAITSFPTPSALIFILLAALVYAVLNSVKGSSAGERIDNPGVTSLSFIGIILFSLYLSLSALLAVPLMQDEETPDDYTQADFEGRIGKEVPTIEDFRAKFPPLAVSGEVAKVAVETAWYSYAGIQGGIRDRLIQWNASRDAAHQSLLSRQTIALETYRSQTALGLGGREVVSHSTALLGWVMEQRDATYRQVRQCLNAGQQAISALNALAALSPTAGPADRANLSQEVNSAGSRLIDSTLRADGICNVDRFGTMQDAPNRTNRVDGLTTFIRDWTRWLIGPESMPLVIIVGLVGFSFLGASLSRVIRLGVGSELKGLSLTDLLLVVLSGASAALVIFLASYGGLVVLGESEANPSPYVVFALCFAAAIFSEDVWAWARTNILGRFVRTGDKIIPSAKRAPDEAMG